MKTVTYAIIWFMSNLIPFINKLDLLTVDCSLCKLFYFYLALQTWEFIYFRESTL